MSVSRIKNLAIAALVLINAFFLTIIILDNAADARTMREAVENLCAILQTNGITITPGDIDTNSELKTMRTVRGDESEQVIASVFLGETVMTDQGAIFLYENEERGSAEFVSGGDFEINLNPGIITSSGDALGTTQRLLGEMGIETLKPYSVVNHSIEIITAVSTYRQTEIFNCTITFIYRGDSLESVKGRYVTGVEIAEDGMGISSVSTALLGFLASVKRGEHECTRIYNVEVGYQFRTLGAFGEGVLTPAWRVDTDTGRYIIDDTTGEIRSLN